MGIKCWCGSWYGLIVIISDATTNTPLPTLASQTCTKANDTGGSAAGWGLCAYAHAMRAKAYRRLIIHQVHRCKALLHILNNEFAIHLLPGLSMQNVFFEPANWKNNLALTCGLQFMISFYFKEGSKYYTSFSLLTHFLFTLLTCAQRTLIPTSARSISFHVIWVWISSSSSSTSPWIHARLRTSVSLSKVILRAWTS